MYSNGLEINLVVAGLVLAGLGWLVIRRIVGWRLALVLALFKFTIPVLYFAYFFDETWTLRDDRRYIQHAEEFLTWGHNFITFWFYPHAVSELKALVGGFHIFYVAWNALALQLIGPFYYAPVLLNVFLTFLGARSLYRIALLAGAAQSYALSLCVFYLIHWDILAWSSFVNLKDIMVLQLTIVCLESIIRLVAKFRILELVKLSLGFLIFGILRYYIPFLMLIACGLWLSASMSIRGRALLIPLLFAAFILVVPSWSSYYEELIDFADIPYRLVHYWMNPLPWQIEEGYTFVRLPSICHWLMALFALLAIPRLWKNRVTRLLLIYFFMVSAFYSVVPNLEGHRHRVQLVFVLCWLQFEGFRRVFLRRQSHAALQSTATVTSHAQSPT